MKDREPTEPIEAAPSSKLAIACTVLFFAILLGSVFMFWRYEPWVTDRAKEFVHQTGYLGVALGFYVTDALSAPIPNDLFTAVGRMGGLGFVPTVLSASMGSVAGGCTGWWLGRFGVRRNRWLEAWMSGQGRDYVEKVRRHGASFLALSALAPLPYSLACWGAGMVAMPLRTVFLVSLLRFVRVALYLWIIERGALQLGG